MAIVVGSFLDWATFKSGLGEVGISGTMSDGRITAGLAGAGLVALLVNARVGAAFGLVLANAVSVVAAFDYNDLRQNVGGDEAFLVKGLTVSMGTGLCLIFGGAVVLLIGSIAVLGAGRRPVRLLRAG